MAKPRGKVKPSISSDPPLPRAAPRGPLIADLVAPAAPAPVFDWKADPDLRAFACLLSFDAGWMTEPVDIAWTFEEAQKVVEVKRPEGNTSQVSYSRAESGINALNALNEIRRRWGIVVAEKVMAFAFPNRPKTEAQVLGERARYLRQLAQRTHAAGGSIPLIEIALVDVVRYCADLVRGANTGDQTTSAVTTRAVASGAILEMINPAPPRV